MSEPSKLPDFDRPASFYFGNKKPSDQIADGDINDKSEEELKEQEVHRSFNEMKDGLGEQVEQTHKSSTEITKPEGDVSHLLSELDGVQSDSSETE